MKKKVLQVIGSLKVGGAETVAMNYYRYADRKSYEFHYLVFNEKSGDYDDEVLQLGGKIKRMDYSIKKILLFAYRLYKLMKHEQYEIVHCHTMFSSGIIMLVANMAGVPKKITHAHTTSSGNSSSFLNKCYQYFMRKFILIYSSHLLAASKKSGEYLYAKIFEKFQVIPNGIDSKNFQFNLDDRKNVRKQLGINDEKLLINVGHLYDVKNQHFLIEVIEELIKFDDKYRLIICGEGHEREKLQTRINNLKLNDKISLIGQVDNIPQFLSAADIFLFPSKYEGLGLSVVEAEANGLPSVISDKIPEEVDITDLVVRVGIERSQISEWVKNILKLERNNSLSYQTIVEKSDFEISNSSILINHIYNE